MALGILMLLPGSSYGGSQVTISCKVSFEGNDLPEETFTVEMTDEDTGAVYSSRTRLSSGKKTDIIELKPGELSAGEHFYQIKLARGDNSDITYSDKVYRCFVVVDAYGNFATKVVNRDDPEDKPEHIEFVSSYLKSDEEVIGDPPVRIRKDVSGKKPDKVERFVFIMRPEDPSYPLPDVKAQGSGVIKDGVAEVYLDGEGEVEIGNITFNKEGVYRYFVSEKDTAVEGYDYDDARFTVTYVVSRGGDGKLTCERTITKKGSGVVTDVDFDNIHHPSKTVRKVIRAVKTGDPGIMWPLTMLIAASMILAALLIDRRMRRDAELRRSGR